MTGKIPVLATALAIIASSFCPVVSASSGCALALPVAFGPGGTYYINPNSAAPFSFDGSFSGCQPETCKTFFNFPSGTTVRCGSVDSTSGSWEALCPFDHNQLKAGVYSDLVVCPKNRIQFEASFTIATTQATTTTVTTETVTGTVTPVSTITSTTTSLEIDTTALKPVTVTIANSPSATITIHPSTTSTKTKFYIRTVYVATTVTSIKTHTSFPPCTSGRSYGAYSTGTPTVTISAAASTSSAAASLAIRDTPQVRREKAIAAKRGLEKRVETDGPLTVIVTSFAKPSVVLTTGPATTTTITSSVLSTTVTTITPPPQTVYQNPPPFTVTAPTATYRAFTRVQQTVTVTATRTLRGDVTVTPKPTRCPYY